MNRGLGLLLAGWTVVGAFVTVAIMFAGGLFLTMNPSPWNFPGDPPLFDVLIYGAGMATMVNLPLAGIVGRRFGQRSGLILSIPSLCSALAVIMLIGSAAGILERHDARWRAVRTGIREYGDLIAAAAGDKNRALTEEEFRRFHTRFLPQPIPVTLPGYGTVHLRMAHGVYPYVGVDFGGGANALFDPRTMICTYSD
jgi:hypothetical protein